MIVFTFEIVTSDVLRLFQNLSTGVVGQKLLPIFCVFDPYIKVNKRLDVGNNNHAHKFWDSLFVHLVVDGNKSSLGYKMFDNICMLYCILYVLFLLLFVLFLANHFKWLSNIINWRIKCYIFPKMCLFIYGILLY